MKPAICVAIASAPTYDPNLFVRGISVADYRALTEITFRPLAIKSVQGTYPPGSTFKMITAMAALEEGLIGPETRSTAPATLRLQGASFTAGNAPGTAVSTSENLANSL